MLFMLILSERPLSVRTFLISLATNISIMGVVLSVILVLLSQTYVKIPLSMSCSNLADIEWEKAARRSDCIMAVNIAMAKSTSCIRDIHYLLILKQ